jgi:hypothetical protein
LTKLGLVLERFEFGEEMEFVFLEGFFESCEEKAA